jgi:hypothetical protein
MRLLGFRWACRIVLPLPTYSTYIAACQQSHGWWAALLRRAVPSRMPTNSTGRIPPMYTLAAAIILLCPRPGMRMRCLLLAWESMNCTTTSQYPILSRPKNRATMLRPIGRTASRGRTPLLAHAAGQDSGLSGLPFLCLAFVLVSGWPLSFPVSRGILSLA